jgi:hypothetical protein
MFVKGEAIEGNEAGAEATKDDRASAAIDFQE